MERNYNSDYDGFRSEISALTAASDTILRRSPEEIRGIYTDFVAEGCRLDQKIRASGLGRQETLELRAGVFHAMRETAVGLNNRLGMTEQALDITRTLREEFSDLPEPTETVRGDEAYLMSLLTSQASAAAPEPAAETPAQSVPVKEKKRKLGWLIPVIAVAAAAVIGTAVYATMGGGPASRQAVKDAAAAIDAIGAPVTADSREAVDHAQSLMDALTPEERERVENAGTLEDAQETLAYAEAAADLDEQIRAIGEMDLDTIDEIERLEAEADALPPEARAFMEERELLNDKRAAYESYYAETMTAGADGIRELLDAGAYEGVIGAAADYAETFPDSPYLEDVRGYVADAMIGQAEDAYHEDESMSDALDILDDVQDTYDDVLDSGRNRRIDELLEEMAAAQLAVAQEHYDSKEYYQVLESLDPFYYYYGDTSSNEDAEALRQEIEDWLGSQPSNGYVYRDDIGSGKGELTIKNGDYPAVIKVESTGSGSSMIFFVSANKNVTVNIKDGDYIVKYAMGDTWYSWGDYFGPATEYSMADDVLEFETIYYSSSYSYTTYELTLYAVAGGNLTTYDIDADEF